MKLLIHQRRQTEGSALMISIVITGIIGVSLVGYLDLVGHQQKMLTRAQYWNFALPAAEAGIEDALTHLHYYARGSNVVGNGWEAKSDSGTYGKSNALTGSRYSVTLTASGNMRPVRIVSEGFIRLPPANNEIKRTIEVLASRFSLFPKGMVAKGQIDMSGNNVRTDSFDSENPFYSTGGQYDVNKAKDSGDVATNSGLINSVNVGNADIYGHVATGPGGSVAVGPNGAVGNFEWHRFHDGIQPGWATDDMNVSFPDIDPPYSSGTAPSGDRIDGVNYAYVLGRDNYYLNELSIAGQQVILVTNNAVLFVNGTLSMEGQSQIVIAPNASLKLYVNGPADIGGNGILNQNSYATNFFYYGCTNNTSLKLSGNAEFTGVIYAPQADFDLGGGGNNSYDFVGASVSKTVKMNGHYNFHYDEALGRYGATSEYLITSWREL
jgi:hypothetical protein